MGFRSGPRPSMPWRPAVASWRLVGIFESRLKHFLGWSCVWVASRPVQNGPERLCRSPGRRGGRMGVQIGRNRNARIAELPRDQIEIANLQGERLSLSEPRRGEREQASSNCLGGIPGKDPGRYCSTDDACQYRADVAEMFPGEPLRLRARPPVLYCAIRAASKGVIAASRGSGSTRHFCACQSRQSRICPPLSAPARLGARFVCATSGRRGRATAPGSLL